jgi:hypothetical protein
MCIQDRLSALPGTQESGARSIRGKLFLTL